MPTLKQLKCHVEIGPKNIQLREYGTTYGDGLVTTQIAVPSQPQNFSIHLTSSGYIAPGLAMFVFIDGVAQCNRNRRGLVLPDEKTDKSLFEVDIRVRQKEERFDDKSFIGREWKFEDLQTTAADESLRLHDDVLQNLGTIEVVVLRCRDDKPGRNVASRYAIDDGRSRDLDNVPDMSKRVLAFSLDGAVEGYPDSPPQEVRFEMWKEAQAAKARGQTEPEADKDGANDDRGRHTLSGLGKAFEKHGYSGYRAPADHRRGRSMSYGAPEVPWTTNPYLHGFTGGYRHYVPPSYIKGYAPVYQFSSPQRSRRHSRRRSNSAHGDEADQNLGQLPEHGKHANSVRNVSKASSRKSDNDMNDADKGDRSKEDNNDNGAAWDASTDANVKTATWGDNNAGDSGNSWDNSNQNNWDNVGGGDSSKDAKDTKRNKQKKSSKTQSSNNVRPSNDSSSRSLDPNATHIKPYWTKWRHRFPEASEESIKDRRIYVVPEEPLLVVPEKFAEERSIRHQVHAGEGKMYQHLTASPKYIDSMEAPYAVFVFRYRSKETLEKMFPDAEVKEDREPFRERIKELSRDEIVEQLIKAKKAAGYSTDSDISSSSASSSSTSEKGNDEETPATQENQAWKKERSDKGKNKKKEKEEEGNTSWGAQPAAATGNTSGGGGKGESWEQTVEQPKDVQW